MAKADTATVTPEARKKGAQQEGQNSIQAGQVDRRTKARRKAGHDTLEGQRHGSAGRSGETRPSGHSPRPIIAEKVFTPTRAGKESRDFGDVRGSRAPNGNRGNRRNTPTRKSIKR
jgi:hypothetical protein